MRDFHYGIEVDGHVGTSVTKTAQKSGTASTSIGEGFRSIMEIKGATSWPQGSRAESTASTTPGLAKLHIGVDAKGFIVAAELTASSRDDASTLPDLLAPLEVPIRRFTADGAYDHRSVYDRASAAGTENVVIVIPPSSLCAVGGAHRRPLGAA